jgi:hypothetical protein
MSITIGQVIDKQPNWFKQGKFFGDDVYWGYRLLTGNKTSKHFLAQRTSMWSDMFGQPKTYVFRVHQINDDLTIGDLLDNIFHDFEDVEEFMKEQ